MKKLLSIVLAVALMSTLVFAISASAAEDHVILPDSASDFEKANTSNGTISVSKEGDSFVFEGNTEWPAAYYWAEENWFYFHEDDDLYLYYDFEVVSGATNVIVYFAGQNPNEMAQPGNFLCLNGAVDPSYVHPDTGDAVMDLPVGHYTGKIAIDDLGYNPFMKDDEGNMMISGVKVFAVGDNSKVVVNELCIGGPRGGAADDETTDGETSDDDANEPPKTADSSNALVFVVVAAIAASVVTVSVVSKKAKSC